MRKKLVILLVFSPCVFILAVRGNRPPGFVEQQNDSGLLSQPIDHFDCVQVSPQKAIEQLQRQTGCRIDAKWATLINPKIPADEATVTLHLHDVRVSDVLDLICMRLAPPDLSGWSYRVIDGRIVLSSAGDLSIVLAGRQTEDLVEGVYPVSDVAQEIYAWQVEAHLPVPDTFRGISQRGLVNPAEEAQSALFHIITDDVDPGSWRGSGGRGEIRLINGALLIRQTPENHRRIAKLITQLRALLVRQADHERTKVSGG